MQFGAGHRLPAGPDEPVEAAVRLEAEPLERRVEPRLVLRHARRAGRRRSTCSASPRSPTASRPSSPATSARGSGARATPAAAPRRDARGGGIAGLLADLVAAGEPVLAVVAHAPHRARTLQDRIGGFAVCSWAALEDDPGLAAGFAHLVAVDPPSTRRARLLDRPSGGRSPIWHGASLSYALLDEYISGTSPCATR